jgi:hypothetical protein
MAVNVLRYLVFCLGLGCPSLYLIGCQPLSVYAATKSSSIRYILNVFCTVIH